MRVSLTFSARVQYALPPSRLVMLEERAARLRAELRLFINGDEP